MTYTYKRTTLAYELNLVAPYILFLYNRKYLIFIFYRITTTTPCYFNKLFLMLYDLHHMIVILFMP